MLPKQQKTSQIRPYFLIVPKETEVVQAADPVEEQVEDQVRGKEVVEKNLINKKEERRAPTNIRRQCPATRKNKIHKSS